MNDLGHRCADVETVVEAVHEVISRGTSFEEAKILEIPSWLKERLLIGDGKTNTDIVLSEWEKLSEPVSSRYIWGRLLLISFWGWLNHFRRKIIARRNSRKGIRDFSLEKFPPISSDDLRLLKASVGISDQKPDSPRVFRLYPRGIVVLPPRRRTYRSG